MEESLARHLLDIGAVMLSPKQPFTWASGLQAPIYCDNRLTLSYPELRTRIAEGLSAIVGDMLPAPDAVVGVATAGIPHATLVADRMGLPLAYVRGSAKKHGRGNQIEGGVSEGDRVAVIEDLISTGGSSLAAAKALSDAGIEVLGVVAVFSYQLDVANDRFLKAGIPLQTLTNLADLLDAAEADNLLPEDELRSLRAWRNDPMEWSSRNG